MIVQFPYDCGVHVTLQLREPVLIVQVLEDRYCVKSSLFGPVPEKVIVEVLEALNASVAVSVALLPAVGDSGEDDTVRFPLPTLTVMVC